MTDTLMVGIIAFVLALGGAIGLAFVWSSCAVSSNESREEEKRDAEK